MHRTKRVIVLLISTISVLLCSMGLYATVIATQGVVVDDPKYYETTGPYSYTLHDWLGDLPMFFMNASPFIVGTAAAVFGLYWWLNKSEKQAPNRAVINAARAALLSILFMIATIMIAEIVVYQEANRKIAWLNKHGPPQ